jgi:hypothetical protein
VNVARSYLVVVVLLGVVTLSDSCSRDKRSNDSTEGASSDCSALEPSNPYQEGTGHYAGFKWGEDGKSCGGNSTAFIEGCEEYEAQEEAYNSCISKGKQH